MTCPKLRFDGSVDELAIPRECRPQFEEIIREAWNAIIERQSDGMSRIDIYSVGGYWRIDQQQSADEIVIRLEVSINTPVILEGGAIKNVDEVRTYVYHELFHLADRLDPTFRFDDGFDAAIIDDPLRTVINAVWDIYIESRKLKLFHLPAFSYFQMVRNDPRDAIRESRDAVLTNFLQVVGPENSARGVFEEVWGQDKLDHGAIRGFANGLTLLPPTVAPPRQPRPVRLRAVPGPTGPPDCGAGG